MKNLKYIIGLFISVTLLFIRCTPVGNYNIGAIVAPSNLHITTEIIGATADNPFGDGSGAVNITANATNAITYKFIFNGDEVMVPSGTKTYIFGITGTHTYSIIVEAIGDAGVSSTATTSVEVLALYNPPAELITMLTADSNKTWRIESETPGHFGVGPADEVAPIWWAANPNDKAGLGAYDDQFIFNVDGTFTHLTNGTVYGQAAPMTQDLGGDKGMIANGNSEFENYPLDDYSVNWTLSAPGGQETLQLSGVGFHGFYVGGNHSYIILSRTDTELHLKTIGADGNAWFVKFTTNN